MDFEVALGRARSNPNLLLGNDGDALLLVRKAGTLGRFLNLINIALDFDQLKKNDLYLIFLPFGINLVTFPAESCHSNLILTVLACIVIGAYHWHSGRGGV